MIRLHIMLNNWRRSLVSAGLGALLVLLAGSANALAAVTVRCVPSASLNPSCTAATAYPTIQAAVTAASPGDVIFVGPGTYNESVTITIPALSLLGAQAGNDARVGRQNPAKESIVNGMGNPAFIVNADYVVIDGFTVTGGTATGANAFPGGILVGSTTAGYYWAQVLNNILAKNGTGVFLYKPSSVPVIEHNLFRNNTAGTGTWVGYGIVSIGVTYPLITENEFTGNETGAIIVAGGSNAIITNNTSESDGGFVFYESTSQCLFSHNQGKNFGRKGVLPVVIGLHSIYPDAAVDIGPGNSNLVISDNDLEKGEAPISNGIAFTSAFAAPAGTSPNFSVNVKNNEIKGFPENGIVAEEQSGGTLQGSWIVGNEVLDNGSDGIFIDVNNHNISLFDNEAEGNHTLDCNDASAGFGTLGTANGWFNNIGNSSYPPGPPPLCTPSKRHGHD